MYGAQVTTVIRQGDVEYDLVPLDQADDVACKTYMIIRQAGESADKDRVIVCGLRKGKLLARPAPDDSYCAPADASQSFAERLSQVTETFGATKAKRKLQTRKGKELSKALMDTTLGALVPDEVAVKKEEPMETVESVLPAGPRLVRPGLRPMVLRGAIAAGQTTSPRPRLSGGVLSRPVLPAPQLLSSPRLSLARPPPSSTTPLAVRPSLSLSSPLSVRPPPGAAFPLATPRLRSRPP